MLPAKESGSQATVSCRRGIEVSWCRGVVVSTVHSFICQIVQGKGVPGDVEQGPPWLTPSSNHAAWGTFALRDY